MWEVPLNDVLWYPVGYVTSSYLVHFYNVIFYHLVPALIVDGLLKLIGQKPRQKKNCESIELDVFHFVWVLGF